MPEQDAETTLVNGGPYKILVVDDEPDLERLVLQQMCRETRRRLYEFVFAHNGIEALDCLSQDRGIDLVITDINMPKMDGLTLLERNPDVHPDVRSVILSAYGDMKNIRTAMNRAAFDFVTKPIDFGDLRVTIERTLIASLVGLVSFDQVGEIQSRVNEGSVPEMVTAFSVAQQSGALVAAGPRLTAAATMEELARTVADISHDRQAFEAQVAALPDQGANEARFERIRVQGSALVANVRAIEESVAEGFLLAERSRALRVEIEALQRELAEALIPAIDDQLFYAMTGYRELDEAPAARADHLSEEEFNRYRHMAGLQANATIAIQLLASAFDVSDIALLEPLRERFESSAGKIERGLSALATTPLHARVEPALSRLVGLGLDRDQGFDLRARELVLAARQAELLASNSHLPSILPQRRKAWSVQHARARRMRLAHLQQRSLRGATCCLRSVRSASSGQR